MAAIRFNAEFIEMRMAQHRLWQHEAEHVLMEEIISEVQELPKRRPRTGRLFDLLPPHIQGSLVSSLEAKR
jgi:hypothetical protein